MGKLSNNFSANPVILNGIVKAFKNFKEENTQLSREHIRPALQFLNAVGGGVVLDCLDEDEIADMLIDNIYGILQGDEQGDEQGVEIEDESEEYEDMDLDGNEVSEEESFKDSIEDKYIVIGQKVNVRVKETDAPKTILVNYLPNSTKIPPLAKQEVSKMNSTAKKAKKQAVINNSTANILSS